MKKSRSILLFIILTTWLSTSFTPVLAQEEPHKDKLNVTADIVSRYIWRGLNLGGSSPSIQPNIEYSHGNFAVGAWGAYSFDHSITRQECDLYLSYTIANLVTITGTDYFLPHEDTLLNHYFNYNDEKTGHVLEISAKFLGTDKIPFSLLLASNVYGNDAKTWNGHNQYSTYIELGYSFKVKETGCNAFFGVTPTKPDIDKGETGYYGNGPGVINLGIKATRDIRITDSFSLPISASFITNPQAENIYLVLGITL